ncbi:MAG: response regulator [Nannocystaceae bacterium]|nr:response regulator [bacterium]
MTAVLFAHERPSVARAVCHVLRARGFDVESVRDGEAAARVLASRHFGALVVDVALPGRPGYELVEVARAEQKRAGRGADVVVLVASVFRKTSYKRRPARLYGADDYVELHHLGDMLPDKLDRHLGTRSPKHDEAERVATEAVLDIADARMEAETTDELASLIIADVVLYNGDRIADTRTLAQARTALADDLDVATDLLRQVQQARAETVDAAQAIEAAFTRLMRSMGRREEAG